MSDLTESDLQDWISEVRDTKQREAEFERALWTRIWLILAGTIAMLLVAGFVHAEPVPAYVGCTLAWDYPAEEQAKIGGFGVFVGERRAATATPDARSVPCDALGLVLNETVTLKVRAWGVSGGHSEYATIDATYLPTPVIQSPTRARIQWEWETEQ